MALQWNTGTTGQTIYLVRWNTSGQAWNGAAFATYTTTRDTWDQVMAEIGVTGLYRIATIPGGDGYATIEVFRQVGGSPDHAADVSLAKGDGYVRSGALWPDDQQLKGFINTDLVEESTGNVATNFGVFWNDGDSAVSDVRLSYFDTIKTKTDFLPSATAGAAGGVFIAGANAATTANITGDLTGNVSGSVGSVTGNVGGMAGTINTFDELIASADTLDTLYAGSDLEADIAAISSSASVSAFLVDEDHTWGFQSRSQTTSPQLVTEIRGTGGFNGLVAMDFTVPMPANAVISTIGTVGVADESGKTEPTLSAASLSPDKKKVHIPVNATSATAGTYTISVTITTTDSQTFMRKGRLVLQ